jgi:hypothetical protein
MRKKGPGKKKMAADERRSKPIKTECLSAFIGVHRRLAIVFFSASKHEAL